jgi:hypothetical protein
VQSAVWCLLTCLMMMFNGIEIPGIQSRIRTEYFLVNMKTEQENWFEQNNLIEWNTEQKSNKRWITKRTVITGNEHYSQHKINHECLCWMGWKKIWPSNTCIGLKYPCDYGTDNCNPICPGINGETSFANESLFASPASWIVHKSPSVTQMTYF